MPFPIKFLSLQKTELEYEVAVRGETPANTVADLRKQIGKLGQLFPSEDILCSHLDSLEDLQAVLEILTKVNLALEPNPTDKNTLSRLENLLHHTYHRINRISTEDVEDQHLACSKAFREHYANYLLLSKKATDPLLVDVSSSASAFTSSSQVPINVSVTCDKSITSELNKLRFDGLSHVFDLLFNVLANLVKHVIFLTQNLFHLLLKYSPMMHFIGSEV